MANQLDLHRVTQNLRDRGIKGTLVPVSGRLYWRCTAKDSGGIRKSRRIPLGLPAHPGQLIEAEARVVTLAAEIGRSGFMPDPLPWAQPLQAAKPSGPAVAAMTVAEARSSLEIDFWQGKVRTSAAERTWERIENELKRLPRQAILTMDLLVAVASTTAAGS